MNNEQLYLGCKQLDIDLTAEQFEVLLAYVNLLIKWNKVYNLTSIKNTKEIVIKHVLDSLSIIKYIHSDNLIDIGSGAGLPGIIIAVARPNIKVTLLDSNSKKTTFLQQVKIELNLNNLTVVNQRVENYSPLIKFDEIIARAFASMSDFVKVTKHLLNKDGKILAMKGKLLTDELGQTVEYFNETKEFKIQATHKLTVPFLDEERHIIEIKKIRHFKAEHKLWLK